MRPNLVIPTDFRDDAFTPHCRDRSQQRKPAGHTEFHFGGAVTPTIGNNFRIEAAPEILAQAHPFRAPAPGPR